MIKIIINASLVAEAERPETYTYFNILEMANKDTSDNTYNIKFKLLDSKTVLAEGNIKTDSDSFNTEEWFGKFEFLELEITITKNDTNS